MSNLASTLFSRLKAPILNRAALVVDATASTASTAIASAAASSAGAPDGPVTI